MPPFESKKLSFMATAELTAHMAMNAINPALVEKYVCLIRFLSEFPEMASAVRGKSALQIGEAKYIQHQARIFANARGLRAPQVPATVPDAMVSVILHHYFHLPIEQLERAKQQHLLSMGVENLVGELLEHYLASILEPHGWVWCSGAIVKAVDFIKPPEGASDRWQMLQVKNRDNSENSSSSAIRTGTTIEKWHRTFSKKAMTNWAAFPDEKLRIQLSESAFRVYVEDYLRALPPPTGIQAPSAAS